MIVLKSRAGAPNEDAPNANAIAVLIITDLRSTPFIATTSFRLMS